MDEVTRLTSTPQTGNGAGLRCRFDCTDESTGRTWRVMPAPPPVEKDHRGKIKPPVQRVEDLLAAAAIRDDHELAIHGEVYKPSPIFSYSHFGKSIKPRARSGAEIAHLPIQK